MLRRLLLMSTLMALLASVAATGAVAAETETVTVTPIEFTIPAGQCPNLPPDVEVRAQGTLRTETEVEGADEGSRFTIESVATGTATDNKGGRYRFSYVNRITGSPSGDGVLTDQFRLRGTGPANGLVSKFRARLTFDAAGEIIGFDLVFAVGDPLDFATFTPMCDPI